MQVLLCLDPDPHHRTSSYKLLKNDHVSATLNPCTNRTKHSRVHSIARASAKNAEATCSRSFPPRSTTRYFVAASAWEFIAYIAKPSAPKELDRRPHQYKLAGWLFLAILGMSWIYDWVIFVICLGNYWYIFLYSLGFLWEANQPSFSPLNQQVSIIPSNCGASNFRWGCRLPSHS